LVFFSQRFSVSSFNEKQICGLRSSGEFTRKKIRTVKNLTNELEKRGFGKIWYLLEIELSKTLKLFGIILLRLIHRCLHRPTINRYFPSQPTSHF
jgi:hypothetical protein